MSASLTIDTRKFEKAISRYAGMKDKTDAEVLNKVMRFWVPFAANKIPKGNAANIRRELTGQARKISRGGQKRLGQMRNTLAAAIVAARLRKRGWTSRELHTRTDDFYFHVMKLVNSRAKSAGYLRNGMTPALITFDARLHGTKPMVAKGRSFGKRAKKLAWGLIGGMTEASARNARAGAARRYGDAFHRSMREVTRMFNRFIREDYAAMTKKAGF